MKEEFFKIVEEFRKKYLNTGLGKKHLEAYERESEELKRIFNEIKEKKARGEDVTRLILDYLLPIKRRSVTPTGVKAIEAYYKLKGISLSENKLKEIADAVFNLISGLLENSEDPERQRELINSFVASPYSLGLQSGNISPVLRRLDPKYLLINRKTVDTVRFISKNFMGEEVKISTALEDYLESSLKLKEFISQLSKVVPEFENFEIFDMFCHWMCDKNLGGYARGSIYMPVEEVEAIRIAEETEDPKVLEELYRKYRDSIKVVEVIMANPYCPSNVKRDFLDYALKSYLASYNDKLKSVVKNWEELLETMEKSLEEWNPPREVSPIPEIDFEDPRMEEIYRSLQNYKQVILYGPPGTSKTFYAKGLALAISGDSACVEFVQFHPSYSYEDFVEGIFPYVDEKTGQVIFRVEDKIFKKICKKAMENPEKNYVLIIDEINRADLSKVFGELFSALEYREEPVMLLYSRESFYIPTNLYIIGTMNTLDKSTIDIDFALMRRFKFFEVGPDSEVLWNILKENNVDVDLMIKVKDVFEQIQEFFPLGHAFFKDVKSEQDLKLLWDHQLSFLLREYFTDLRKEDFERVRDIYMRGLGLES